LRLPDDEEIMSLAFFVLTQYRRVTDGRTDRHVAIAITHASIASRGQKDCSYVKNFLQLFLQLADREEEETQQLTDISRPRRRRRPACRMVWCRAWLICRTLVTDSQSPAWAELQQLSPSWCRPLWKDSWQKQSKQYKNCGKI